MKKVSIIVPVYNTEQYLEKCLTSIRYQTYTNFECLIIDDGSTDNSLSIANEFVEYDNRFKIFKSTHSGPSAARNIGLDNCTGDYVNFIDSDDYVDNNHLELLVNKLETKNYDIVVFSRDEDITLIPNEFIKYIDLGYTWSWLMKHDVIGDIRFNNDIFLCEDIYFMLEVFNQSSVCHVCSLNTYHYNKSNPHSLCNTHNWSIKVQPILATVVDKCPNIHKDFLTGYLNHIRNY